MIEILGYISLGYFIGAMITYIVLYFGVGDDKFGIGTMIAAGCAFFWPLSVPYMIIDKLRDYFAEKKEKRQK